MSFSRISILGLGLIGGSLALAIRKRLSASHVTGYDVNAPSVSDALAAGAIHAAAPDLRAACDGADAVILCLAVPEATRILGEIASFLKRGSCVTDVCSTKRSIVAAAGRLLPEGVHFVGGHPMAGRELSGFAAARADLFEGATCLLTPVTQTDSGALEQVEAMWRSLGAKPARLSPADHDRMVAQISHLPHVLASALVATTTDQAVALAGPGFRDVTRIAASDGALWRDILLDNTDEIRRSIMQLRAQLDRVDALLDPGRAEELRAWLDVAAARRRDLGKST